MFKKTKIAAVSAAVLGLSSMSAQAVQQNEAGSQGEVLIFPYYNVNNRFVTAYNITNTTNQFKAIKIRFRESENSNDVLDFNLYLSPFDVFTMQLHKGSDEGVLLTTADKSCTHPAIPADGVLFRHGAYTSTDVADVREGYLEVIEMGVVNENAYITNPQNPIFAGQLQQFITSQGILHVDGVPVDCTVIEQAWQEGVFSQGGARSNGIVPGGLNWVDPKPQGYPVQERLSEQLYYGQRFPWSLVPREDRRSILQPTGGIVGTSILVDGKNIAGFVAEPISLVNYSTRPQHYLSSDENFYLLPSLASGNHKFSDFLDEEGVGQYTPYGTVRRDWGMDDRHQAPRTSVPSGINPMPVADAMLVTQVANQYFLGENTKTDWVLSAPMRKHAIYNDYEYRSRLVDGVGFVPDSEDIPVGVKEGSIPSTEEQKALAVANGYWKYLDISDVNARFDYWNREEGQTTVDPGDFSPPLVTPPSVIPFEREVNILALEASGAPVSESVLGSDNARVLTLAPGFVDGWGAFTFKNGYDLAGPRYAAWVRGTEYDGEYEFHALGVPLSSFMAVKSSIGAQNVGETFPAFYTRERSMNYIGE